MQNSTFNLTCYCDLGVEVSKSFNVCNTVAARGPQST